MPIKMTLKSSYVFFCLNLNLGRRNTGTFCPCVTGENLDCLQVLEQTFLRQ